MYKLQELIGRVIWNVREPRTGSTWFLQKLLVKLARTNQFFDIFTPDVFYVTEEKKAGVAHFFKNRQHESTDAYRILNTHEFVALEHLNNYKDPIVIRNARKNKTEQFTSLYIGNVTKKYNVTTIEEYNKLPKLEPVTIPEHNARIFIEKATEAERYWQQYATQYENEIVYYEDLIDVWESKLMPVKLSMAINSKDNGALPSQTNSLFTGRNAATLKLPYNKRELITNYDTIDAIIKEHLDPVDNTRFKV